VFSDALVYRATSRWLWGVALLAFGAVGVALVTQYALGMLPCPWCILQRLFFITIGLLAILAAVVPRLPRLVASGLALALCVAGASAALYQKLVASKLQSCNLTLADRILTTLGVESWWPWLLSVQASCADAAVDLIGIPYEIWSLGLFVLLALALVSVLARTGRTP
jgi:protein dithiol:quinone oxidoreductase